MTLKAVKGSQEGTKKMNVVSEYFWGVEIVEEIHRGFMDPKKPSHE